jgi:hypothetical protein
LPGTVRDATAIYNLLIDPERCAYPAAQIRLLTDEQATRQNILAGLDWLNTMVTHNPAATVLIYFSGHGGFVPGYHLVPHGYDMQRISQTAVSGVELSERIRALQSQKLLVLLDCCHAGGMTDIKSAGLQQAPLPPELEPILARGSGRVLIASSRKDEYSYMGQPYSIFTQALREGLAGYGAAERDGVAYMTDVALYVGRMVPNRTQNRQHPILKLAGADNFAIAYYAAGAKTPLALPWTSSHPLPLEAVPEGDLREGYRRVLRQYQHNLLLVEERMAVFFDQAAVPLDLERTRSGIIEKIAELEQRIEHDAGAEGWSPPKATPPRLQDDLLLQTLLNMRAELRTRLDELQRGQTAIYQHISPPDREMIEALLAEVVQGRIEQGLLHSTVDEVRNILEAVQQHQEREHDTLTQTLAYIQQTLQEDDGSQTLQQQLELTLPIIPLLLDYKLNLGTSTTLADLWQQLTARISPTR